MLTVRLLTKKIEVGKCKSYFVNAAFPLFIALPVGTALLGMHLKKYVRAKVKLSKCIPLWQKFL